MKKIDHCLSELVYPFHAMKGKMGKLRDYFVPGHGKGDCGFPGKDSDFDAVAG